MNGVWGFMGAFEDNIYGEVDQEVLNATQMNLTVAYTNGSMVAYPWNIGEGIQEPFRVDDVQQMKGVVMQMDYMDI